MKPGESRKKQFIIYFFLIGYLIFLMIPIYWMALSSITPRTQIFTIPPNYFPSVTFENFVRLIYQLPFYQYLLNSIIFGAGTVVITIIICFIAAYAFARLKVRGSGIILFLLVLSMALPEIVTVIPLYRILQSFNLIDTITGLILIMSSVLTPFTVWLLVSFIKQVPVEIEEAAIVDGANFWQVLWHVVLPVMKPSLITVAIINFINSWNNLLYPLVFSNTTASKTLTVSMTEIFQARTPYGRPWELISALGMTMILPMVIMVFAAQKGIISGLTRGALD